MHAEKHTHIYNLPADLAPDVVLQHPHSEFNWREMILDSQRINAGFLHEQKGQRSLISNFPLPTNYSERYQLMFGMHVLLKNTKLELSLDAY